jgi:hypothetical protein
MRALKLERAVAEGKKPNIIARIMQR